MGGRKLHPARIRVENMREKKKKVRKYGWKSRFVKLMGIMTICFNVLSTPLTAIGIATMTATTIACDKDNNGTKPTQTPDEGYTIEYVYTEGLNFGRGRWYDSSMDMVDYNAFADTVAKYANDPKVKKLHMLPRAREMLAISPVSGVEARAPVLDNLYEKSGHKLTGEGTILDVEPEVLESQIVQDVFCNKLKIELVDYRLNVK